MKTRLPDDAPVKAQFDLVHDCLDGARKDIDILRSDFADHAEATKAFRANTVIALEEIKAVTGAGAAAAQSNHDNLMELKGSVRTVIDMQGAVGSRIGVEKPEALRQPLAIRELIALMTAVSGSVFAVGAVLWKARMLAGPFLNIVTAR